MSEWYRNVVWNEDVEAMFLDKLKRSRNKAQYLRIQAHTLVNTFPEVALSLLEHYFSIGEFEYDLAQALLDQATAYKALGRTEDAINSYLSALKREEEFPNSITAASLQFSQFVWTKRLCQYYATALEKLTKNADNSDLPIKLFDRSSTAAFIQNELGETRAAAEHAKMALEYAKLIHSGFQNHPKLGLVGEERNETIHQLKQLLNGIANK